jgi:hypothetical protein
MRDMYRAGHLKLAELVTTEYAIEDIVRGCEDIHADKNIRGAFRHSRPSGGLFRSTDDRWRRTRAVSRAGESG